MFYHILEKTNIVLTRRSPKDVGNLHGNKMLSAVCQKKVTRIRFFKVVGITGILSEDLRLSLLSDVITTNVRELTPIKR